MEITFWQKLLYLFQFNQNFWHNLGLGLIYFILTTLIVLVIRWGVARTKVAIWQNQNAQTKQKLLKMPVMTSLVLLVAVTGLFTILSFFLTATNTWTNLDYLVTDEKKEHYLTTINRQFVTNSIENGRVSGMSYLVLHRMEINQPKHHWTNRLARIKANDRTNEAKILGETERTVLYYSGEWIGAVSKANGKSTVSKKQFYETNPELGKAKVSEAFYDAEVGKIYIKMNTAQNYEVDPTTYKATAIQEKAELDDENQAIAQEEKIHHKMNGRANVIVNPAKNPYFTMLATKNQINQIRSITDYTLNFQVNSSQNRYPYFLYDVAFSIPESKMVMDQKTKQGFLEGHFLTIPNAKANAYTVNTKEKEDRFSAELPKVPAEQVKELPTSDVFGSMVKSIGATMIKSYENEPMFVTKENEGLILHKKTIDKQDQNYLLSKVQLATGKVLWTIDLYHLVSLDLMDENTIMAYSKTNFQVMYIDLSTGKTRGYDYQYNLQLK